VKTPDTAARASRLLVPSSLPEVRVERYMASFAPRRLTPGRPHRFSTSLVSPILFRPEALYANVPEPGLVFLVRDVDQPSPLAAPRVTEAWQRWPGLPRQPPRGAPPGSKWWDLYGLNVVFARHVEWNFSTLQPGGTLRLDLYYTGAPWRAGRGRRKPWTFVVNASGPATAREEPTP